MLLYRKECITIHGSGIKLSNATCSLIELFVSIVTLKARITMPLLRGFLDEVFGPRPAFHFNSGFWKFPIRGRRLKRIEGLRHPRSSTSSKASENLDEPPHGSGEAENQHWMLAVFHPSGGTASKTASRMWARGLLRKLIHMLCRHIDRKGSQKSSVQIESHLAKCR